MFAILFSSCGSNVTEFTVKNESTDFDGDLYDYLEVVDGSYKATMVGGDLKLNVKLKAIQTLDDDMEFEEIRAELLDESGMPLSGVGTFYISKGLWVASSDNAKVDNALKKGSGEFAVQLIYSSWGACSDKEALKIASKDAKSFSITSETRELSSNSSSSSSSYSDNDDDDDDEPVIKKSSGKNWDKVLADYESYTDKYIQLLKKANSGDMSAMTEYVSMLEKAQSLQESLSDADDEMTPAQLQKFMKIQQKLINAASNL